MHLNYAASELLGSTASVEQDEGLSLSRGNATQAGALLAPAVPCRDSTRSPATLLARGIRRPFQPSPLPLSLPNRSADAVHTCQMQPGGPQQGN